MKRLQALPPGADAFHVDVTHLPAQPRSRADDRGFTLIELVVAIALMSVIGVLSLSALVEYRHSQAQQQTADALLSDLRGTGQRAVSEGRTYCLYVNDSQDSWTVYRSSCASASQVVEPTTKASEETQLGSLSIAATSVCPASAACIYFYPRGTATQATLAVTRAGKPSITITVEGLTSRVDRT